MSLPHIFRRCLPYVLSLWVLGAGLLSAQDAEALKAQLKQDTRALTQTPHRLSGTDAYYAATDYVLERLRLMGFTDEEIVVQDFPTFQSVTRRDAAGQRLSTLTLRGGQRLELFPLRPNAIIPPTTPPNGISGPFIYGGDGSLGSFKESVAGKIALLDYDSGNAWRRAFRMGARAVIFVKGDSPTFDNQYSHHTVAPANFPRYYYEGTVEDLLDAGHGRIDVQVVWRGTETGMGPDGEPTVTGTGRNVLVFLKGTDPFFNFVVKDEKQPEWMVLAAPLDSFGTVPERSPGAYNAMNAAALLAVAEDFKQNPPRRNMVLAFFDNKARGHKGAIAFYKSFLRPENDAHFSERERSLENELEYVALIEAALEQDNPVAIEQEGFFTILWKFVSGGDEVRQAQAIVKVLLRRISNEGLAAARDAEAQLNFLQLELESKGESLEPAQQAELEAIRKRRAGWNAFKEALEANRLGPAYYDEYAMQEPFELALAQVHAYIERTRNQVALKQNVIETEKRIREKLDGGLTVLHTSLMLGDATSRWGLLFGGESALRSKDDRGSLYVKVMDAFDVAAAALERRGVELSHFARATARNEISPPHLFYAGKGFAHSGDIAGRLTVKNMALTTSQDAFRRLGTPGETYASINFENVVAQLTEVLPTLREVANGEALSGASSIARRDDFFETTMDGNFNWSGSILRARTLGSSTANTPVNGGMVMIMERPSKARQFAAYDYKPVNIPAFDDFFIVRSNASGAYGWGPFETEERRLMAFAADFDERGFVAFANDQETTQHARRILRMFPARHGAFVLPPQPLADEVFVFEALNNSNLGRRESFRLTLDGVATWFCEEDVEGVKVFDEESVFALNIDEALLEDSVDRDKIKDDLIYGTGLSFRADGGFFAPPIAERSAADISRLNQFRLDILRARNISKSSVDQLHAENRDLLKAARQQIEEDEKAAFAGLPEVDSAAVAEALAASSWLKERRVYDDTRGSMEDLVTAVIFLLLLNIPFAFAMERLLIGATNIYRQTAFFAMFFLGTFFLLYFTHPAFAIAATPVIIFLGFAIVLLSGLVIFIIMQKFEVELKALQGVAGTVHSADVSRFNTILAAMNMGISTMRRRPLRTALTAATVTLLTFTILCFASFGREIGIVKIFEQGTPGYTGVNYHRVSWGRVPVEVAELSTSRWAEKEGVLAIAPRIWIVPERANAETPTHNPGRILTDGNADNPIVLRGILGLDRADAELRTNIASMLGNELSDFDATIWVTEPVAEQLGASPGDNVMMGGLTLKLGPILDPVKMLNITDMDGSSILPVDLDDPEISSQHNSEDSETTAASQSWEPLLVDSIAIVSNQVAERLGGDMRTLHIYTDDAITAIEIGEELASMLNAPVNATRTDGVYRHVPGAVLQASGLRDLFFPVLLGGLVIFGTMLGSVADREKEIYTFSALGLAPPHVTGLFFAEALVYSVIGGMGGYLFAQGVLAILTELAALGLITVPEINYSSTNAIFTIFIVMLTVLISAVFPALKASRSANPGVMRNWKLPAPKDDLLDITFPFTVSEYDITGVVSFLKEHFDAYKDTGMGSFMSRDTEFFSPDKSSVGLRARLALAPFDLGVTQDFRLYSAPSQIPGIDEVKIQITRLSGQPKDWARLNKVLMDDLRKQFLIWRSIPRETMETYRMRTLQELNKLEETAQPATA
ncbi:MAG: FtsX-like permease family protein [Opitutales bacterium]